MEYSIVKGVGKGIKYFVIFLVAGLIFGLPVAWKELTVGGALVLILNALKVKWNIKLP